MINTDMDKDKWTGLDFKFDHIAQNVFYPIYDVIAEDILRHTKSTDGKMIDIGCGGGHLGLAVLKRTLHEGYFVDVNESALIIAQNRAEQWGLYNRTTFVKQDVHKMDFPDGFADLIISRGSYHFWEDIEKAFLEIYRILAPKGKTYIGGGLGNSELTAMIRVKMAEIKPDWSDTVRERNERLPTDLLTGMLDKHLIDYEVVDNQEQGRWFILTKK